jgi:hypothetical protein
MSFMQEILNLNSMAEKMGGANAFSDSCSKCETLGINAIK